jgi:hypothetical protein
VSKPVYDSVSDLPFYAPGDATDRPVRAQCCCQVTDTFSIGYTLSGCGVSPCDTAAKSGTIVWVSDSESEDTCFWGVAAGDQFVSIGINYDRTSILIIRGPSFTTCWTGTATSFDCAGSTVFTRTGGTCSGPATITVVKI